MRNSTGWRRSGQQLSKWYEKLAASHRGAALKRPAEIQQSLEGFIKRRGSHNLHICRRDSTTSVDILKDPAIKVLKSSKFRWQRLLKPQQHACYSKRQANEDLGESPHQSQSSIAHANHLDLLLSPCPTWQGSGLCPHWLVWERNSSSSWNGLRAWKWSGRQSGTGTIQEEFPENSQIVCISIGITIKTPGLSRVGTSTGCPQSIDSSKWHI